MDARTRVTRTRIIWILLGSVGFCFTLSVALIAYRQYRYRTEDLPWYRPSSEAPQGGQWQELDPAWIHVVTEDKQAEAQEMLEDVAVVELTDQQAAEYIGQPLPAVPGTKPYLVRSLIRFRPGVYSVYVWEEHLQVHHGSLGSGRTLMSRQALVLQLERRPSEVYLEAWAAR